MPVMGMCNSLDWVNKVICRENRYTDFLFPAKSTKLETLSEFAIEGALGFPTLDVYKTMDMYNKE